MKAEEMLNGTPEWGILVGELLSFFWYKLVEAAPLPQHLQSQDPNQDECFNSGATIAHSGNIWSVRPSPNQPEGLMA